MEVQEGVLVTGVYTITNVRHRNLVEMDVDNSIIATVANDGEHPAGQMLWIITLLSNGRYTVRNAVDGRERLPRYAVCSALPKVNDEISSARNRCQWKIVETSTKKHYIIQPNSTVDCFWGLRNGELGTNLTFRNHGSNDANHWEFRLWDGPIPEPVVSQPPMSSSNVLAIPTPPTQAPSTAQTAQPNQSIVEPAKFTESRIYGQDTPYDIRFNDVDDVAALPGNKTISRIKQIEMTYYLMGLDSFTLNVTYVLSDGSEFQLLRGKIEPQSVISGAKCKINLSESEIITDVYEEEAEGWPGTPGPLHWMLLCIKNTRTSAIRFEKVSTDNIPYEIRARHPSLLPKYLRSWLATPTGFVDDGCKFHFSGDIVGFAGRIDGECASVHGISFITLGAPKAG